MARNHPRRINPIYNPTAVLSGRALRRLVNHLAGLEFNPAIHAAQHERDLAHVNDQALMDRISGYNKTVNDTFSGISKQNADTAAALAPALTGNTNTTMSILAANRAQDVERSNADTALRGSGLGGDSSQRLAEAYARQQSGVEANLKAQANAGAVQAGGWAGLSTIMQGAAAMRGADNLAIAGNYGANREAGLQQKITDLQGQKGAAKAKYLEDVRKSEFEKAAAVQTLHIKQTTAAAELARANKPVETTYQKEAAKWAAKLGITPHRFITMSTKQRQALIKAYTNAGKGQGGKTPDQINRESAAREAASHGYTYQEWLNLSSAQRQKIAQGKSAGKTKQPNGLLAPSGQSSGIADASRIASNPHALADKVKGVTYNQARLKMIADPAFKKVAPSIINAALDKIYLGYMTEGTKRRLHAEGYNWKRVLKALGYKLGGPASNLGNAIAKTVG